MITIRRRTALVLAVTATQRLCLGAGLVGYAQWLRRDLTTAMTDQVLRDNRAVAAQFAGLIGELGLGDLTAGSRNWRRLQGVVERIALPNEGFLCIIANHTGKLLGHPEMRRDPGLAGVDHGATFCAPEGWAARSPTWPPPARSGAPATSATRAM